MEKFDVTITEKKYLPVFMIDSVKLALTIILEKNKKELALFKEIDDYLGLSYPEIELKSISKNKVVFEFIYRKHKEVNDKTLNKIITILTNTVHELWKTSCFI